MTSPTFDGYPIFAQMARLESVTVPLDEHGHHDLDAMADAASQRPGRGAVPAAQPDRHRRAGRRHRAVPAAGAVGHRGAARRGLRRVPVAPSTGSTRLRWSSGSRMWWCCAPSRRRTGWPGCGSATASARPSWPGSLWTMQLPFGIGITGLVAVAASYDAESQLQQRIRMITVGATIPAHAAAGDGCLQHRQPCQLRVPAAAQPTVARGVRRTPACRSATTPTAACGSPSATGSPPGRCWRRWSHSRRAELRSSCGRGLRYEEAWPRNRREPRKRDPIALGARQLGARRVG